MADLATIERKRARLEELRARRQRLESLIEQRNALQAQPVDSAQGGSAPPPPTASPAAVGPPLPSPPQVSQESAPGTLGFQPTEEQSARMQQSMDLTRNLFEPGPADPSKAAEMGATMGGEIVGRQLGARIGAMGGPAGIIAGTMIGGGVGSATALAMKRKAMNEEVDIGDLALEFGMSLAPEFVMQGLRKAKQLPEFLASRMKPGMQGSADVVATKARELPTRVMKPPTAEAEDTAWKMVRGAGFQVNSTSFGVPLKRFKNQKELDTALTFVRDIGSGPMDQFPLVGDRMADMLSRVYKGKIRIGRGLDIGMLSHVQSNLMDRVLNMGKGKKRSALMKMIDVINDQIQGGKVLWQGKTHDGKTGRDLLVTAKNLSAKKFDHYAMSMFVNNRMAKPTQGLKHFTIDMRPLQKLLSSDVASLNKIEARAAQALKNSSPALKSELEHFMKTVDEINVDTKDVKSIGEILNSLVGILAQPLARQRAFRLFSEKRGIVTLSDFVALGLVPARELFRSEREKKEAGENSRRKELIRMVP